MNECCAIIACFDPVIERFKTTGLLLSKYHNICSGVRYSRRDPYKWMSHDGDSGAKCACVLALDNRTTPVSATRVHVISRARKDSVRTDWETEMKEAVPRPHRPASVPPAPNGPRAPRTRARGEPCSWAMRATAGGGAPVAHSRLSG